METCAGERCALCTLRSLAFKLETWWQTPCRRLLDTEKVIFTAPREEADAVAEPMIALAAESTAVPAAGWAAVPEHLHYNIGGTAFQQLCRHAKPLLQASLHGTLPAINM